MQDADSTDRMFCGICIDWQPIENLFGTDRSEVILDKCIQLLAPILDYPPIREERLITVELSDDGVTTARRIIAEILNSNATRITPIPLLGCVLFSGSTCLSYRSLAFCLKSYSMNPSILVRTDQVDGTVRMIDGLSYRVLEREANCFYLASREGYDSKFSIHTEFPEEQANALGDCTVCIWSAHSKLHLECLECVLDFCVASNRKLLISPDLNKFVHAPLSRVFFQGQTYLATNQVQEATLFSIPNQYIERLQ